jgi:hypothetical protein
MKPCPTCQKSLSDNATTCPSCGHKFEIDALTGLKRNLPIIAILLAILFFLIASEMSSKYQETVARIEEKHQGTFSKVDAEIEKIRKQVGH